MKKQKFKLIKPFQFGKIDGIELFYIIVLLFIGLLMLYSASIPTSYNEKDSSSYIIKQQLFYAGIGLVAMFLLSQINLELLRKFYLVFYVIGLVFVILTLIPQFGGSETIRRWFKLGPISFQPSEFMKFFLVLTLAAVMSKYHKRIVGHKKTNGNFIRKLDTKLDSKNIPHPRLHPINETIAPFLICVLSILLPAFFIFKGSHYSGTILILLIGITMMFLGDFKKGWFIFGAVMIMVGLIAIFGLYKIDPELLESIGKGRISQWIDKNHENRWQINNALYAIGSGGLTGVGFGESTQKYHYVSEPQNDMIFSIVCEELGFLGAFLILVLFAALFVRGMRIGLHAKDRFSQYLAMGISVSIALHVILNVAVASDLIPNTGISLPFFSSGGSALMTQMVEMGVLLAVSKQTNQKNIQKAQGVQNVQSIQGVQGVQ